MSIFVEVKDEKEGPKSKPREPAMPRSTTIVDIFVKKNFPFREAQLLAATLQDEYNVRLPHELKFSDQQLEAVVKLLAETLRNNQSEAPGSSSASMYSPEPELLAALKSGATAATDTAKWQTRVHNFLHYEPHPVAADPYSDIPLDKLEPCDECTIAAAYWICDECKGRNGAATYCTKCKDVLHPNKKHEKAIHGVQVCANCEKAGELYCEEEKKFFCAACSPQLHVNPLKSGHKLKRLRLKREADEKKTTYFYDDYPIQEKEETEESKKLITVIVPFFNEESRELYRTLYSLCQQNNQLAQQGNFELHVLLVSDGWWKASKSMKKYLRQMFPEEKENPWSKRIAQIVPGQEKDSVETFVLQRLVEGTNHGVGTVDVSNPPKEDDDPLPASPTGRAERGRTLAGAEEVTFVQDDNSCFRDCLVAFKRFIIMTLILATFIAFAVSAYVIVVEDYEGNPWHPILWSSMASFGFLALCGCCLNLSLQPKKKKVENLHLKCTLLIKRDNRRKHNSHAWFFNAFCAQYDPLYAFCTDCGTTFSENCLTKLALYLWTHWKAVAVTGRQRVMSAEDQGNENESLLQSFYRAAQCFDYEASLSSFMGAFAMAGMLPVIPGPCGLYRWKVFDRQAKHNYRRVNNEAISFYLETVCKNPDETDTTTATLLLAEDRVLSYAAVFKNDALAKTAYVPRAIFYFEAETDPLILLQQRRRWINGTMAGYIWLLWTERKLMIESEKSRLFILVTSFLVACQFFLYIIVAFAPGIFSIGVYFALQSVLTEQSMEGAVNILTAGYILVYVFFVYRHSLNDVKLDLWLFHLVTFVNALGVILVLGSTAYYAFTDGLNLQLYTVFGVMGAPFILGLFHPQSLPYMFATCMQFYLFLPTMVGIFGAYAFSRSWELTWGNRPSDALESLANAKTVEEQKKRKEDQYQQGKTIAYMIVIINIILIVVVITIRDALPYFTLALSFIICIFAIIQMGLSFIWGLFKYALIDVIWWGLKLYLWNTWKCKLCGRDPATESFTNRV